MASKKLHYLTVQDILWINLQVTGKVNNFTYAELEEATFYQYGYGDSDELLAQAARFVKGFLAKKPLSAGNKPTAFLAAATFLRINAHHLTLGDSEAANWFERGATDIGSVVEHDSHYHAERIKDAVTNVLRKYPATIQALGGNALEVIADGAIH